MPIPQTPLDLVGPPAREVAYRRLRAAITAGELVPGARLDTEALLAFTGSRRAPLREALTALAGVGLVAVSPRRYTQVTPLDARRARESLTVHAAYVARAIQEAAPALTEDDRRRLADVPSATTRHAGLDRHAVITEVVLARAGNRDYSKIAASLLPYIERALRLQAIDLPVEAWNSGLTELRAALLERDADAAGRAWDTTWRLAFVALQPATSSAVDTTVRDVAGAPPTLREKVADTLTDAILDGTLVQGEILREAALTTWLGVSRTPVREALVQLQQRGLVDLPANRPARVATLDAAEFRDGMRALGVLRVIALREVLTTGEQTVRTQIAELLDGWTPGGEPDDLVALSQGLDRILVQGSENLVLKSVAVPLAAKVRWQAVHDPAILRRVDSDLVPVFAEAVRNGRVDQAAAAQWALWDLPTRAPTGTGEHR